MRRCALVVGLAVACSVVAGVTIAAVLLWFLQPDPQEPPRLNSPPGVDAGDGLGLDERPDLILPDPVGPGVAERAR